MLEIRTIPERAIASFIDFRTDLYAGDPCAVPYLFSDEKAMLCRRTNPSFEFCDAEYYMAYRDGRAVGRVAAIINHRANERWQQRNVRFGYLDFVDDREVSAALIDAVRAYGRQHGCDTIIGPMGFMDLEREGLLVEGFDTMQTMHANHNYPYYQEHLEALGFTKDNDWVQQMVQVPAEVPAKFARTADMIRRRYRLLSRHLTKHQLLHEGYATQFFHVLNRCYADLYEFSVLDERQIADMVRKYIAMADLNLVSFVFDDNLGTGPEALVGFGVAFPSFSQALRRTHKGRLWPFGWWHLLRTLWTHNTDTVDLMLIGVLPEYRAKGANALIFDDLTRQFQRYGFRQALTLAMMETNTGVLSAWQHFDARTARRLRSYKDKL